MDVWITVSQCLFLLVFVVGESCCTATPKLGRPVRAQHKPRVCECISNVCQMFMVLSDTELKVTVSEI